MTDRTGWGNELAYALCVPGVRLGLAVSGLVLVVLAAYAAAGWWPARHQHAQLETALHELHRELATRVQRQASAEAAASGRQRLAEVRDRIAKGTDQAELTSRLYAAASRNGVAILSESNTRGRALNGYVPLVQELVLAGEYGAIRAFLRDIHALPSWTVAWELRLSGETESADTVRGGLTLATYRPAPQSFGEGM